MQIVQEMLEQMNGKKRQKLELVWPGKDERPQLEPRILIEEPDKSHHATARRSDADIFDNMLIKGDNLCPSSGFLAPKAA